MTEGNPLFLMVWFALPIFLGNLFQLFYGIVDTKIVGSAIGEDALAAVGAVSTLYTLLTGFFNGLTLGFSVLTARYFGAGETERMKRTVAGSIALGYGFAVLLILGILCFLRPILGILRIPERQMEMAYAYIGILALGMFATLAYNLCANMLRAVGDSLTPLFFLLLAAVVNVLLDYVLILAFHMGVAGAAAATVAAQLLSVIFCVLRIRRSFPILQIERRHFRLSGDEVRELLKSGISMGMMSSLVNFGTLILQSGINALGTAVIVAHTAARKVFEIWGLPISVLGASMATYSSQNYGAGKYGRIREGLKVSLLLGFLWCAAVFVMAHTISPYCIGFLASTDNAEILYWGSTYLKVDMTFQIVCMVIVLLRNTMQGIGDYVTPIFSSLIELLGKTVFTFLIVRMYGYWGVIWTEPVSWICMAVPLAVMILRNPLLKKQAGAGENGIRV